MRGRLIVITGEALYGRCDEVPGVGWVATSFFHVWFVPLLPIGGVAVVPARGRCARREVAIPVSSRSLLVAWGRTVCGFAGLASTCLALASSATPDRIAAGIAVATMLGLVIFSWIPALRRASYGRALELAKVLELTEREHVLVDLAYGRMTSREAKHELARLDDAAFEASALAVEQARARRAAKQERAAVAQAAFEAKRAAGELDAEDPGRADRMRAMVRRSKRKGLT